RSLPGPSEPDPPVSSVEFLGLDFAWRKSCGSPPNYPRTTGCIRSSTHTYMSVHVHAHRRKGEARWHDWVAAPWTRFGHTCCSGAPPPRRTCAAVCTCRARRRIRWSARRRPGASSRSSRTCTRTTTIDPRRGTSIPPTASPCAGGVARWLGAASRALGSSTESAAECAACGRAQGLTDRSLSPRESPAFRRGGRLKRRVSTSSPTQPKGEESYAVGLMDGTDGRSCDRASPPRRDFRSSTQRPSYE